MYTHVSNCDELLYRVVSYILDQEVHHFKCEISPILKQFGLPIMPKKLGVPGPKHLKTTDFKD